MGAINPHSFFFLLFAVLACAFAVAVLASKNIVRMAFYLVLSLGAVSGLYFLAGADFVGGMQLMIYVGGTMVLLAFGVMLTARGPFVKMTIPRSQWIAAIMLGGLLLGLLARAAFSVSDWTTRTAAERVQSSPTATRLGMGLLGVRVDQPEQEDQVLSRGMSGYLLAFEIVSVHLVVVLIGAAYLARARRRVPPETEVSTPT
ncbi:MAG: NADH-quinone oxidoreductase subunit J family protein [Planctomycetota bacterium]|jgi:NADH-quinone oxidoreductase subunit J